jgi:preprotein translocase subunit SecA
MSAQLLSIDTLQARSPYPERADARLSSPDAWARALLSRLAVSWQVSVAIELRALERAMARQQGTWQTASDAELRRRLRELAAPAVTRLRRRELHPALLCVAEIARRTLGLQPYPAQLLGAATLLRGQLAEMQTGEGKTLTAGLAACVAGVAGVPVHVITVNDYLAERDAAKLAPMFSFAGLSVGVVVQGLAAATKRVAYGRDITYCTNKELVFDYLRDRVAAGHRADATQLRARALFGAAPTAPMLRGLHLALVDEADSVLIDEARTPLILAEKAGAIVHADAFARALQIAGGLIAGEDFLLDAARRDVRLTATGRTRLAASITQEPGRPDGPWRAAHAAEHLVTQALRSVHLFLRDRHYLVDAQGQVQVVDEYTGRVLPGRIWEQGLHQMIETKERLALSEQTQTLARITYQRFFPRYLRLAGMTGTGRETAVELAAVYRLRTVRIPTHRPSARRRLLDVVCDVESQKWQTVAAHVARWHAEGRPVLIGTRSIEASERLSRVLAAHDLVHRVLNARQDAHEAELVAAAGQSGAITVATNMAGRGTDIELGAGVAQRGGLGVVLTEYHESPRIDRQLFGRCARQGDPGSCVAIVALDDALFAQHGGPVQKLLVRARRALGPAGRFVMAHCRRRAQARAERLHARTRSDTLRRDLDINRLLAFSGDPL